MRPIVVSIAGSDCSAGAGIQADLKAIEANDAYAATVITAITAQNSRGVREIRALPSQWIRAQLAALLDDLPVAAIKTGMLPTADAVRAVAGLLRDRRPDHLVCDPVLAASTGEDLVEAEVAGLLVEELFPLASLVTPNGREAELLAGRPVRDLDEAREAAEEIRRRSGATAVLITGGELRAAPASDLLVDDRGARVFEAAPEPAIHTHGTGCVFSSAIAAQLAHGADLDRAIRAAKRHVALALRHGLAIGAGRGPTDPLYRLRVTEAREG